MKKIWFGLAALVVGSSLTFGNAAGTQTYADDTAVTSENIPNLTPKRSRNDVILAQEPPRPVEIEQGTAMADVMPAVAPVQYPPVPAVTAPTAYAVPVSGDMPIRVAAAPVPAVSAVPVAPVAAVAPPPAAGGADPQIYEELNRLSEAVQKLKKDTAKPDTKKAFSTPKVGGRLFLDSYTIDQSDGANIQNRGGIRELRIGVSGNGYDAFDYKIELGVGNNGQMNVYDAWTGAKNVPLFGYLRAGHYRVETGIGYLTSGLNDTLMEPIPPCARFNLGRKLGVSSEHLFANDRVRLFYGFFQGEDINVNRSITKDDQGQIFNTRLTAAPYYAEKGKYVLHVGGNYSYVAAATGVSTTPGNTWLPTSPLNTGTPLSNHHHRSGVELSYQSGPFAIHTEGFFAQYGKADGDRLASGFSTEFTYFLTKGSYREYNLATGTFGSAKVPKPFHPFACGDWNLVDTIGAWQFVAQYSYVDLEDWRGVVGANVVGGRQNDFTLGMNWFWTSNLRWIFSYTHSQQNVRAAYLHREQDIFGTSLRVSF